MVDHLTAPDPACALCPRPGQTPCEPILWRDAHLRVIRADEPHFPGFLRVIWHAHVREMTDLDVSQRTHLLDVVYAAETTVRRLLQPDKINLASLGNQVPHLHWHVIPRFAHDPAWPGAVWAYQGPEATQAPASLEPPLAAYGAELADLLGPSSPTGI